MENDKDFKSTFEVLKNTVEVLDRNYELLALRLDKMEDWLMRLDRDISVIVNKNKELELSAKRAENISSCLANGIQPD